MKKIFSGILLLFMALTAFAAQRTVEEAAALAAQFFNAQPAQKGIKRAPMKAASMRLNQQVAKPNSSEPALYVYNNPNGGWVIISADDNAHTVLAYSDKGTFDGSKSNVAYMLDYYAERIAKAQPMTDEQKAKRVKKEEDPYAYATITPLLGVDAEAIQWNQDTPWNNMCPIDGADDTHSYTGCVATAAAQIMRFWKWPAQGEGATAYSWESDGGGFGKESVDFSTGIYDWYNMLPQYKNGQYTQEQADAVALFMYHVGVATHMGYGGHATGGSGSSGTGMLKAMHEFFGYTQATHHKNWDQKTHLETEIAFETELKAGRPIFMGGNSHAFLCDGADGQGRFHINWGWGSASDGYYYLYALDPNDEGIGASTSGGSYSKGMDCFFGLEPEKSRTHATGISLDQTSMSLLIKESKKLEPTVTPDNASNKGVYYVSNNENVATVDYKGKVTGISAGTATITAKTCDGNLAATCAVTVTNEYASAVEYAKLNVGSLNWTSPNWQFIVYDNSWYPWVQFYFKAGSGYSIAGTHNLAKVEVWPDASDPNYAYSNKSCGWINFICIGKGDGPSHQGNTYRYESEFIGEGGLTYHVCDTMEIYYKHEEKDANDSVINVTYYPMDDNVGDGREYELTFIAFGDTFCTTISHNHTFSFPFDEPLINCSNKVFVGWTTVENYSSTTAPSLAKLGDPISANTTYYAVFAEPDGNTTDYSEVASMTFATHSANGSTWYDPGYSFDEIDNLIESSNNMTINTGAWLREGVGGLRLGGSDTGYKRDKGEQGFITFDLTNAATISKVAVNCSKKDSNSKGKLWVDINDVHSQNPIVYGEDAVYIPNKPTSANSLTLATSRRDVYIRSITLYTGGGSSYTNYTTVSCDDVPSAIINNSECTKSDAKKVIENHSLYIIRGNEKFNIFGQKVK